MVTSTILAQGVEFLKFSQKGKGVVLKKEWVSLTLTNPFESYDVCVLLIYTISIGILCVSQERLSFVESNQQSADV